MWALTMSARISWRLMKIIIKSNTWFRPGKMPRKQSSRSHTNGKKIFVFIEEESIETKKRAKEQWSILFFWILFRWMKECLNFQMKQPHGKNLFSQKHSRGWKIWIQDCSCPQNFEFRILMSTEFWKMWKIPILSKLISSFR